MFNQEQTTNKTKMKTDREKLVELMCLTTELIDTLEDFGNESCEEYREMVEQIISDKK